VKITIVIDGVEVSSQVVSPGRTDAAQQPPGPGAQTAAAGLEAVYERAAAMGALDAGPAPGVEGGAMPAAAPQPFVGEGSTPAAVSDQSAGAAPNFPPGQGGA
jgi:hypothetical protein